MIKKMKVFEKYASGNLGALALLISDHDTAMHAYWDKDLVCRYANRAYVDWFGKTREEMINKIRIDELLGPLYEKKRPYIEGVLLGSKQLFEREIPLPDGSGIRHSLATYIPDINNGEVLGFFVHVADVTYLKNLEKEVANAKRDILRNIIETEEKEKRYLVEILRESINQRLAASKMTIERERKKGSNINLNEDVGHHISDIIKEINLLCQGMIPTEIELLGLVAALELYLDNLAQQRHKSIDFVCEDKGIEKIMLPDKYSVFRIIQNLIKIVVDFSDAKNIEVSLNYVEPNVNIKLLIDAKISLNKRLKEYNAIVCRVDYYSGKITELLTETKSIFDIEFCLAGKS